MANWTQGAVQATFDAKAYASDLASTRSGQRSGSGVSNGFLGIGGNASNNGYSVVGINVNEIPNMRTAIRNYVETVQNKLNELNVIASSEEAMKGAGIQEAIKEYVRSVSDYCQSLTSQLLAFSDKLVKVQEAWENSDANISSSVSSSAAETSSTAKTSYTEQF